MLRPLRCVGLHLEEVGALFRCSAFDRDHNWRQIGAQPTARREDAIPGRRGARAGTGESLGSASGVALEGVATDASGENDDEALLGVAASARLSLAGMFRTRHVGDFLCTSQERGTTADHSRRRVVTLSRRSYDVLGRS